MGGKVSKAKRPKRRWIGVTVPSTLGSRSELLDYIASSNLSTFGVKVYDCYLAGSQEAQKSRDFCGLSDDVGVAILCVLLRNYNEVRSILQSEDDMGLSSISSSGKIRLVRERMCLPKPSRR